MWDLSSFDCQVTSSPAVMSTVSGINAPLIEITVGSFAGGESCGSGRSSKAVSIMLSSAFASGMDCSAVHPMRASVKMMIRMDFSCMIAL